MKKVKILGLVIAAAMSVSLFVGCSSSDTASDTVQNTATAEVSESAAQSEACLLYTSPSPRD